MGLASAGVAGRACGADVDGDAVKTAAAKKAVAKPHKDRANVVAWCPLLPLVLRAWAVIHIRTVSVGQRALLLGSALGMTVPC